MSREFAIECLISDLAYAREHAVAAGLGEHTIAEIEHLAATARANLEEFTSGEIRNLNKGKNNEHQ